VTTANKRHISAKNDNMQPIQWCVWAAHRGGRVAAPTTHRSSRAACQRQPLRTTCPADTNGHRLYSRNHKRCGNANLEHFTGERTFLWNSFHTHCSHPPKTSNSPAWCADSVVKQSAFREASNRTKSRPLFHPWQRCALAGRTLDIVRNAPV
jgi:hypothetical protein